MDMTRIDSINSFYQQLQIQIDRRIEKQSRQAALFYLEELKGIIEAEIGCLKKEINQQTKDAIKRSYNKQDTVRVNTVDDLFNLITDPANYIDPKIDTQRIVFKD